MTKYLVRLLSPCWPWLLWPPLLPPLWFCGRLPVLALSGFGTAVRLVLPIALVLAFLVPILVILFRRIALFLFCSVGSFRSLFG